MDVEFIKAFADLGKQIESQVGGLAVSTKLQFDEVGEQFDVIGKQFKSVGKQIEAVKNELKADIKVVDSKLERVISKNYLLRDGDNTEYKV